MCIYGDSHLGAVKRAVDGGLVDLGGYEVEYWGASGPHFRLLKWEDNRVIATGEAVDMVRQVNARGRTELREGDFDAYLFYGARLGVVEYMAPYLHRIRAEDEGQSLAVLKAAAWGWLDTCRSWHVACHFAATGADVTMVPCALPSDGVRGQRGDIKWDEEYPLALEAEPEARALLWRLIVDVARENGVTFLPQPEETIVRGVLTDAAYAVAGAVEARDPGHKTPEFAALCLERAFASRDRKAA